MLYLYILVMNFYVFGFVLLYFYENNNYKTNMAYIFRDNYRIFTFFILLVNVLYLVFDIQLDTEKILLSSLFIVLFIISMCDLKDRLVSDNINILLFAITCLYVLVSVNDVLFVENVIYSLSVIGFVTLLRFIGYTIYNREIIGEGDFIPISIFILLFGVKVGLFLFLLALFITIPIFMGLFFLKKLDKVEVPFIPFVMISLVIGLKNQSDILFFINNF